MSYSPKKSIETKDRRPISSRSKKSKLLSHSIHSLRLFDTDHLKMAKWKSELASEVLPFAIFYRSQLIAMVDEERTGELLMLGLWARRIAGDEVWKEFQLLKKRIGSAL